MIVSCGNYWSEKEDVMKSLITKLSTFALFVFAMSSCIEASSSTAAAVTSQDITVSFPASDGSYGIYGRTCKNWIRQNVLCNTAKDSLTELLPIAPTSSTNVYTMNPDTYYYMLHNLDKKQVGTTRLGNAFAGKKSWSVSASGVEKIS